MCACVCVSYPAPRYILYVLVELNTRHTSIRPSWYCQLIHEAKPTPVLGGVVELQPFGPGGPRLSYLSCGCSDCPGRTRDLWMASSTSQSGGRSPAGAPLRNLVAPGHRFAGQEQVSSAAVVVLSPRLGWQRGTGVSQQLGRSLVKADHRPLRVIGLGGSSTSSMGPRSALITTPASATAWGGCSRTVSWDREGATPTPPPGPPKGAGSSVHALPAVRSRPER